MKPLCWLLAGCSVGSDGDTDSTADINHTGGLRILTGMDAVEIASVTGPGDSCGRHPTVVVGDHTGDGVSELLVGCDDPYDTGSVTDLYVLNGAMALDDAFTLVATMPNADINGFSSVGDLDADGLPEVGFGVVAGLLSENELVWWFVRPGSTLVGHTAATDGAWTITGSGHDPGFGPPVGVGDLDADEVPDLIVGQRPASNAVSGRRLLTSGLVSVVTDALRTMGGFGEDERALDFAPVGDVDGDDSPDVATVVLDWSMEYEYGASDFVAATVVRGESVSDPNTTMKILGRVRGSDRTGQVEALGDLDGDGMTELAVLLSMDDTAEIAVVPSGVLAAGVDVSIAPYVLGGGETDARELITCDLDGDGLLELVSDVGIWDGRDLLVPGTPPVGPGVRIATCAGDLDGAPGSELVRGTPEGY